MPDFESRYIPRSSNDNGEAQANGKNEERIRYFRGSLGCEKSKEGKDSPKKVVKSIWRGPA